MNTLIITEVKIVKYNNRYFSDLPFSTILKRYSIYFKKIILITRVKRVNNINNRYVDISDLCKEIIPVDNLKKELLQPTRRNIINAISNSQLVVLRMPSILSIKYYRQIKKQKKKYMTEVMGCAWDAYWNHGISGKIIALPIFLNNKKIIKNANYSLYVTSHFLQNRYPCNGITTHASNVCIDNVKKVKIYNKNHKKIILFTAAALDVRYKGQQFVIKAMPKLKKMGIDIEYRMAGPGSGEYLKRIAKKEKVEKNIAILGMLSKEKLLEEMSNSDIYIQPSLQEGLPRSVIEAMSIGLVCLGSNTAGIPELIEKEFIFKRRSSCSIAQSIRETLKKDLNLISETNYRKAKEYNNKVLDRRRISFYNRIIKDINNG